MKYKIMQEPGASARARRDPVRTQALCGAAASAPRMRRVALVEVADQEAALELFVKERYPNGHAQFQAPRYEWSSSVPLRRTWHPDDGNRKRARRWRVVVTLANGSYVHEAIFEAWAS